MFFEANHSKSDNFEKIGNFLLIFCIICYFKQLMSQINIGSDCRIEWKFHFLRVIFSWAWNELSFKLISLSLSLNLSCAYTSQPELEARAYKLTNSRNWASSAAQLKAQRSSQLAYALHYFRLILNIESKSSGLPLINSYQLLSLEILIIKLY